MEEEEIKKATIEDVIRKMKQNNRKSDSKLIQKAYDFAKLKHGNQLRKSGEPYIIHPTNVAYTIAELGLDEQTICAALLHDVVEDTNVTFDELEKEFSPEIIEALKLLTHDKNVDYLEYVRKIKNNPIARKVKLADLYHNSDPNRMENPTQKDLERKKTTYDASKTANDKAKQNEKTARCQLEMAESTYNNSKIRLT